jgi:hypothetical protein
MLSSLRKESANIYAKAAEAVLARLTTGSGRRRSHGPAVDVVCGLFEKFKAMRCALLRIAQRCLLTLNLRPALGGAGAIPATAAGASPTALDDPKLQEAVH